MARKSLLLMLFAFSAALVLTAVGEPVFAEILKKTKAAQKWEDKDSDNRLVRMKDEDGLAKQIRERDEDDFNVSVDDQGRLVLRCNWSHKGVSSKSGAERDNMATDALFEEARLFVQQWNEEFSSTKVTFGGVEFKQTEGGWSQTRNHPIDGRTYKAGGTAVGFILVKP